MSSLEEYLQNTPPLETTDISWDGVTLVLSGVNWNLSTQSSWRILKDGVLFFGCLTESLEKERLEVLIGKELIVNISDPQSLNTDLSISIGGYILEIFTVDLSESWVLNLPNNIVLTGLLE